MVGGVFFFFLIFYLFIFSLFFSFQFQLSGMEKCIANGRCRSRKGYVRG